MVFSVCEVVLDIEMALGVIKVELERDVASDGGVDDELLFFLERWVPLQSLIGLGKYLAGKMLFDHGLIR